MNRRGLQRAQRGFALVLALGAVAVVLAMAAALDVWVDARLEQARLIRLRVQDDLDIYGTRATVLYLLATQRFTRAGLTTGEASEAAQARQLQDALRIDPVGGELMLEGSAYRGIGRVRFALQEESGLVALNSDGHERLRALLRGSGADEASIARLVDALADYTDPDSARSLNGAEEAEYRALGLAPPPNAALRAVPELWRVLGWRDWLDGQAGFRTGEWMSTAQIETFNPNTAPASLLAHLDGIGVASARTIVEERARLPFQSAPDFAARAGLALPLDDEQFRFFPSDRLRVLLWPEGADQAEVLELQLTPLGRQAPWQIGGSYRTTRGEHGEAHEVPGNIFGTSAPAAR